MNEITFRIHRLSTYITVEYGKDDKYPTIYWDGQTYEFESSAFHLTDMDEYYTEHASTLGLHYVGKIKTYTLMQIIATDLKNSWEVTDD